ncbi:MAG: extensin [Streptomyces turgidiscabies]|nr:extensin [Streptomyces turgidiscabies]
MADDDRYGWLDHAAAERLLSGKSPEALLTSAGPEARDQAEQLAKILDSLSVDGPQRGAELPGEAAALAAFRKARPVADLSSGAPGTDLASDIGVIRVGGFGRSGASRRRGVRPARRSRPLRLGLGAVLAAGMVGSVAMAATVGVLPNPFRGEVPGHPTATVSAAEPRGLVPASPSPDGGTGGKSVPSLRPDPTSGGSGDRGIAGGADPKAGPGHGKRGSHSGLGLPGDWRGVASSCRDLHSGKKLDAERGRALEKAAKGLRNVPKYCEKTLKHESALRPNADTGTGTGAGAGAGKTGGDVGAQGGPSGAGDNGGNGHGATGGHGGNDHGNGNGNGNGNGGGHAGLTAPRPVPTPTSFAAPGAHAPRKGPAPAATPSYGMLPLPKAT